uniref:EGF-like domain-containing protein n=1 Tax=Ascaris lumbricoides TaxID=6252 RepID=A0A0M3I8B2_ASCLU
MGGGCACYNSGSDAFKCKNGWLCAQRVSWPGDVGERCEVPGSSYPAAHLKELVSERKWGGGGWEAGVRATTAEAMRSSVRTAGYVRKEYLGQGMWARGARFQAVRIQLRT